MHKVELNDYGYLVVSEGTLNPEHIIPAFLSFLSDYVEDREEKMKLEEFHAEFEKYSAMEYFEGCTHMNELLYEDIWYMMEEIAPKNAYFGSSDGDGACIGYWMIEENEF